MGEGASLPKRKPWLGAAAGSGPSGHGVALGSVRSSSLPPRRTLLGFQRTAPSQGQVCSAVGPALCQLPARSRSSSRDPGFGKTGGRQFPGKSCLRTGSFAAPRTLDFFTGAGFGALRQICKKRVRSDSPVEGDAQARHFGAAETEPARYLGKITPAMGRVHGIDAMGPEFVCLGPIATIVDDANQ